MESNQLIEWLMENSGPIIKHRTATELMNVTVCSDELTNDLLNIEKVKSLLLRLDDYGPITVVDSHMLNKIHNKDGAESIVAELLDFGLRSGIGQLDLRLQVFRQYVDNDFVSKALSTPYIDNVSTGWAIFIAGIFTSYFIRGGYRYEEVINYAKIRLNLLYRAASENTLNIYLSDSELMKYPKRPQIWCTTPVIRPEYDPCCNDKPLPNKHDIYTLAYYPKDLADEETEDKINRIIEFILDEKYQSLHYGLLWYKANRRYYMSGWSPTLPCFFNFENEYELCILLFYMDLMSHFKAAQHSKWFQNCLDYLEQFRMVDGTYCFPKSFFRYKEYVGCTGGLSIGSKDKQKSADANKVESTFRMLLLKSRLGIF
ncbi:MAG: hypothetical protein ABFD25_03725 [Clostridiaceae bacterium]